MTQARWSIPILGSMLLGVSAMSSSALAHGQAVGWGANAFSYGVGMVIFMSQR